MSDELKHECGVTLLRLRRNADYYAARYGMRHFGSRKLALLLEKQHNRGQDGAGMAALKLDAVPGEPYYRLEKSNSSTALTDILSRIDDESWDGEVLLGHLRYGTFGRRSLAACHPVLRESPCRNRTILLAGNFNLTNTSALFARLTASGHHLSDALDSHILLAMIGHRLEKLLGPNDGGERSPDLVRLFREAAPEWDGGYFLCGMLGNGECFALRDPRGIRPGYWYFNDDVVVTASERPAIQTAFDLASAEVEEVPPGALLLIDRDGKTRLEQCLEPEPPRRCVFERIYFSRGNDADIQRERRKMGKFLTDPVLDAVDGDWDNSFFSYIPNTAYTCFLGMLEELVARHQGRTLRFGQIAVKDVGFRTFISDAECRKELSMHVYDVVYGLVRPGADNLVVLDDSIVRGNTMRHCILRILDRLGPKRIVVASAAPPVCYPDGYGIDMASLGELVAFEAAVALVRRKHLDGLFQECVAAARSDLLLPDDQMQNRVKPIYDAIGFGELCEEIGRRLRPEGLRAELRVVFQTPENLRRACPDHTGDWYFSGDYPTPGGNRVVNQALIHYVDAVNRRAY